MLILAAAVCVYFNTCEFPFAFDDQRTLLENVKIRDMDAFYSPDIFRAPRPLVDFTFALNYHFGRLHVLGYHLVNLFIHILNGIVVFFLSRRIFQKLSVRDADSTYWMSLFSALLFVVHPIQTQAVTYISQRYTSMAALFYMVSVLCYMIARDAKPNQQQIRRYSMYALTVGAGLLAFFCKQNAASFPLAIGVVEYVCYDKTWAGWKRKIIIAVPLVALFGLAFAFNLGLFTRSVQFGSFLEDVFEAARETREITRWQYLCTQFNVISIYIRLLFLPINQNLDYLYPMKTGFFDGATAYLFLFLAGILAASIGWRKKHPVILFGVLWFFITLSVESSIFPIKDALFEHRLYLPMFGFSMIISDVVFGILFANRLWAYSVSAVIVVSLAVVAHQRNVVWKTSVSLWTDVVYKAPHNYRGYTNLAHALELDGKIESAMSHYDRAIQLRPDFHQALSNKGALLGRMGKVDEAVRLFKKVLNDDPDYPLALNNLGVTLASRGNADIKEAIGYFKRAVQKKPGYLDAGNNLAIAYQQSGDYENALQVILSMIKLDPDNAAMYSRAGVLLDTLKRYPEAIEQYNAAIKLDPNNADVYFNKGNAQLAANMYAEAVDTYKLAVQKNPAMVEAMGNMGMAYMRMGNNDEAVTAFQSILKIKPNMVESHANLGVLYYSQGNIVKALEHIGIARRLRPDSVEIRNNFEKILNDRIKTPEQ